MVIENYNLTGPNECFHFSSIVSYPGGRDNMLNSSVDLRVHPRVLSYITYNLHDKERMKWMNNHSSVVSLSPSSVFTVNF